jgi:isopentenyl-diphosphate delta-isomerase
VSAAEPLPRDLLARDRKAEHIRIAMERSVQLEARYFEAWAFEHVALPEMAGADVDTGVEFLGKTLRAPLLVSCMTGGTEAAARINRHLAAGAEAAGVAMGVGSQRKAIEDPSQADSFRVRDVAPTIPVLANLGAVQLNYGFGLDECRTAVDMIEADALVFHLNVLQEALQPEGQTDFRGLLDAMAAVAAKLDVPVAVKEVGCGLSEDVGRALVERGIRILDSSGLGGTSWARIEARRSGDVELGEMFADWGIPTPESIRQLARIDGATVIGSGGLRSGVDAAKAIALGADLAAMAYPFLEPATESAAAVEARIARIVQELRIAMLCAGVRDVRTLQEAKLVERSMP